MKKIISILFYFTLLSVSTIAQQNKTEKVAAACEALRKAMINPSKEQFESLLDDSLSYGHSGGHIDRKAEFIDKLITGKSDFVSIDITGQTIDVHRNTAFVRHELNAVTNDNNKPGSVHLLVLLVWIKEHGSWKLVARQAVKPS